MLFGTDGIRGEVVDSPSDDEEAISQLLDDRMISARLMRVVGEALTRVAGMNNAVIIGWDDRPRNGELVAALTVGLHLGALVILAGISLLGRNDLGLRIPSVLEGIVLLLLISRVLTSLMGIDRIQLSPTYSDEEHLERDYR